MKHILSASQFNAKELSQLFQKADKFRAMKNLPDHRGKVVATIFYEPSTRTRLSFESAAVRLGAGIISTENAAEFSSAIKGETIEDSTRVLACYADIIVMRHPETGAAARAAAVSKVPIINAGDGKGEHPTQALLDTYTIQREKGRLNNLRVVIGGDLAHGRTARSLAQMLSLYKGNHITFVSTAELQIGRDIKEQLRKKSVGFEETNDMIAALSQADVVYWTRLQKERLAGKKLASNFVINNLALKVMPRDAIIMHPLPRVDEIDKAVDSDPRTAYFRQAENGLYIRMAILDGLLNDGLA